MTYKINEALTTIDQLALGAALQFLQVADVHTPEVLALLGAAADIPAHTERANRLIGILGNWRIKTGINTAHDICSDILARLEDDDMRSNDLVAACAYIRAGSFDLAVNYINDAKDGYGGTTPVVTIT